MSTGDLVHIEPAELKFQFELRKQGSCSMTVKNKTDDHIVFKVKTTNPKKYCVRPNTGVIMPEGACNVTVTMQAQKEAPPDMQCKDKFLVQSVRVPDGTTTDDITSEMFNKEDGKVVEEFKMKVVYVAAKLPSPVPEESEEGSPSSDGVNEQASLASAVSRSFEGSKVKDVEVRAQVAKLTNEKASAIQQNQKLKQELELLKREMNRRRSGGVQLYVVILIGILGILLGYLMKKT